MTDTIQRLIHVIRGHNKMLINYVTERRLMLVLDNHMGLLQQR